MGRLRGLGLSRSTVRALNTGAIAGMSAAWVMTRFTSFWIRAIAPRSGASSPEASSLDLDDRATASLAKVMAFHLLSRTLTPREARVIVPFVRYGIGAIAGAAYGLVTSRASAGVVPGATWGIAIWLLGDEVVLPLLERSTKSTPEPRTAHAQALAAHIVYGITTDLVLQIVRHSASAAK
jgi:hypothetical protein